MSIMTITDTFPGEYPVPPKSTTSLSSTVYNNSICMFCNKKTTGDFITCSLGCLKANTTSKERNKIRIKTLKRRKKLNKQNYKENALEREVEKNKLLAIRKRRRRRRTKKRREANKNKDEKEEEEEDENKEEKEGEKEDENKEEKEGENKDENKDEKEDENKDEKEDENKDENKEEKEDGNKDEGILINISSDHYPYLEYTNLNEYYKENSIKKLHYVKSVTSHDGYDRHGPKAYCHEIIIVYMCNFEYIVDTWCAEYRFWEDQSLKLYNSKIYSKQKFKEYYNIKLKKKDYENDELMDFSPPAYDLTNLGGGNYKH